MKSHQERMLNVALVRHMLGRALEKKHITAIETFLLCEDLGSPEYKDAMAAWRARDGNQGILKKKLKQHYQDPLA